MCFVNIVAFFQNHVLDILTTIWPNTIGKLNIFQNVTKTIKKIINEQILFRLANLRVHFNSKISFDVEYIFTNHFACKIAILEIDGFMTFDELHQPAVLPQLPFPGLAEYLAVSYLNEKFARVTQKLKRPL